MSVETKAALDQAIAMHVADELEGAVTTGYALIASAATADDFDNERTQYLSEFADHQPLHVAMGLTRCLTLHLDNPEGDD